MEDVWNTYKGGKRAALKGRPVKPNDQNPVFQLFFLIKNKNQDIEVVEVEKIDFTEVKKRLEKGESVYITRKRKKNWNRFRLPVKKWRNHGILLIYEEEKYG